MPQITGKSLNRRYGVDAKDGRYRETGDWASPLPVPT